MYYKNVLSANRIKGVYKNIEKYIINTPLQYSEDYLLNIMPLFI